MASVNKVIIIGNLGRDPELRYTQGGTPVCTLSVATTRVYRNKSEERVEETEWHRITVWSKQAESCNQYLSKGRMVMVTAKRIAAEAYIDKEGKPRAALKVTAGAVKFLDTADIDRSARESSEMPF